MLGSYAAAISCGLAATRWGLSIFASIRKKAKFFVPLYVALFILSGIFTYREWIDALPVIASISGTYALFCCEKLKLRVVLMIGGAFWMLHNFLALSYGPFVMETFILFSNALMIYRLKAENKKLPADPEGNFLTRFSGGSTMDNLTK